MSTPPPHLKSIAGQPSWRLATADVEAYVSRLGGHLAPVTFDRRGKKIRPFALPPWAGEKLDRAQPPLMHVMRGDFFCLPFGGNATPFRGEKHPPHGETANARWNFVTLKKDPAGSTLHLTLKTRIRPGRVDKFISVRAGQPVVYSRHVISGMSGPMNLGHHAILRFPPKPGSGLISTSPFQRGQVYIHPVESPEEKGYSSLLPGALFDSLENVPTIFGTSTDLSRYPARRGYEDIVMIAGDPSLPFAWTAVSFPEEGYVWFALKDPRVLRQTLFWISNGRRHYPPWNGRHLDTMGLEEVTSFFHPGLAESVRDNTFSQAGFPTSLSLKKDRSLTVNLITGAVPSPRGFDRVKSMEAGPDNNGVTLTSASGKKLKLPLDLNFLCKPREQEVARK